MELGEKLVLLRALEGNLRGLNRALTKSELVRLIREEQGEAISQAYLSQLESGKRPHMTEKTRELLARFFKVHPGYLVSDPEGYDTQLTALPPPPEVRVDEWLEQSSDSFRSQDPELLLKRGYSITLKNGKSVRSASLLTSGDVIVTRFAEGTVKSKVE